MILYRVSKALPCVGNQMQGRCVPHRCKIEVDHSLSSSFTDTRAHRVLFTLIVFLTILAAVCVFNLILGSFPSPAPPPNGKTPSPMSPGPGVTPPRAARGSRKGTIQVSDLPPVVVRSIDDRNAAEAEETVVSSLAEDTCSTKTGTGRRTQTSGVHAASDDTLSPGPKDYLVLSITADNPRATSPRTTSSIDCLGCERCLEPASTVESATSRGVALNPVQDEQPSHPSLTNDAQETIIKSLLPRRGPISQYLDVVPHSSLAHSSRESLGDPIDGTSAVGATVFMLIVASGVDGLEDPKIDYDFILKVFRSDTVCLVSLLDDQATRTSIRDAFRALYREAQQNLGSRVLVILTGLGELSVNMCLFGGTTIGAQDFQDWQAELHAETPHPRPALGIIFDMCRSSVAHSNTKPGHDLSIVWSCSAGQRAYALEYGTGLPSSCFLASLFLAARDSLVESTDFEHALKSRLAQQGDLLLFLHNREHEGDNTCGECPKRGKCDLPGLQELDRGKAGRDTLHALGELIKSEFPDVAHCIHAEITEKMEHWKFLGSRAGHNLHLVHRVDSEN